MVKKVRKNSVFRYTARIIPKSLKATKNVGRFALKKIDNIFISTIKKTKNISSRLDKRIASTIRSITKRKRHY